MLKIDLFQKKALADSKRGKESKNTLNEEISNINSFKYNKKLSSELLHSYFVSFGASQKSAQNGETVRNGDIERLRKKFTPPAQRVWDKSIEIAKGYGHTEVTYYHLFKAVLENMKKYIEDLETKRKTHEKDIPGSISGGLENNIDPDIYRDKAKRAKLKNLIQEELEILNRHLESQEKSNQKTEEMGFQRDLISDINTCYLDDYSSQENGPIPLTENILYRSVVWAEDDDFSVEVAKPFITRIEEEFMIDRTPIAEKPHVQFFDTQAEQIWKNLSWGPNMLLLYERDTNPEHLVNSFIDLMQVQHKQFGSLNNDNTDIIVFNKNVTVGCLERTIEKAKETPERNTVIVMNFNELEKKEACLDESELEILKELPPHVKLLITCGKDKYYSEIANGEYRKLFESFGDLSLPILTPDQAKKVFKETPALMKKLGKPFSQPAIDRCIEYIHTQKGSYPEKALALMKSIVTYYVDKKEITLTDVDKYLKEIKSTAASQSTQDNTAGIVFDTKVKLADLVGQKNAKDEAKGVVKHIRDKAGTKGYIIFSEDGMPGSGRRYTAEAIAGEAKIPFIPINAVDFGTEKVDIFDMGILSPEASVKKLFSMAKTQAEANPKKTALIFIDNFEHFAAGELLSEYGQKAFAQLQREMEKASEEGNVDIIVIGSTNNPNFMGDSAIKSNKFTGRIALESPARNLEARHEILSYYVKKKKLKVAGDSPEEKDALIRSTAETTEGFPLVYLIRLLDTAKSVSKERGHKIIDKSDFTEAYLQITSGRASSKQDSPHRKTIVTSHECGHALTLQVMYNLAQKQNIPWYLPERVNFITLDPRGRFGGAMFSKDSGNDMFNFETLFADLVCAFGGHSCEKGIYNIDGSWGISADMNGATELANAGIRIMGLGPNTGKISIDHRCSGTQLSPRVQHRVDKDVDIFLKNALIASDMIVKVYEGFVSEFTERYKSRVGTGECIIHGEVFQRELNEWIDKHPEKREEIEDLNRKILQIMEDTKKGRIVDKDGTFKSQSPLILPWIHTEPKN